MKLLTLSKLKCNSKVGQLAKKLKGCTKSNRLLCPITHRKEDLQPAKVKTWWQHYNMSIDRGEQRNFQSDEWTNLSNPNK